MTAVKNQPLSLELKKTIKAPLEVVYKAWIEPEQMQKWFGCDQCRGLKIAQDFRVGGQYRVDMHLANDTIMTVFGEYKEIIPNKKIVYSWSNNFPEIPADNTEVTVEFSFNGESTEVYLKHVNFQFEESATSHTSGWSFALDKLSKVFANA